MEIKTNIDSLRVPSSWSFVSEIIKSSIKESDSVLLTYVLTWNIHGKLPSVADMDQILPKDKSYDLYVVNTQECSKSASVLNSSKTEWEDQLKNHFGSDYKNIASNTLSSYHITIFIKTHLYPSVTDVKFGNIKTGFMNIMANKGAVAISFKYKSKSLLFINSHLSSGQKNINDRNNDFFRINTNLLLSAVGSTESQQTVEQSITFKRTVTDIYDVVIWSGDFNYRINLSKDLIMRYIETEDYETLFEYDQMVGEINTGGLKINDFNEGVIAFPPTYKFEDGTDNYFSERTPAWCDRVLYKVKRVKDILLCKYYHIPQVKISDHKPVFAVFKIDTNEESDKSKKDNEFGLSSISVNGARSSACNIF